MDFKSYLDTGVPVAILIACGFGVWRTSIWLATNVITPAVKAHTDFLAVSQKTMETNTVIMGKIETAITEMAVQLKSYDERVSRIVLEELQRQRGKLS